LALREAAAQFGPFGGRAWFNTAHQGPLPRAAVAATQHAAHLKAAPHLIRDDDFRAVPERLRGMLAELVGGSPEQIVLGNSTSYGLHLIANGLDWHDGDEVLTIDGDYPATVLPWRRLEPFGVQVRAVRPAAALLTPGQLAAEIRSRTRLVAVTWVDAVVCCGYKWLCGPYGTGFAWLHRDLLDRLRPQQAYWLAMQTGRGLDEMRGTTVRDDLGVRAFDVFCPAAFASTLPWIAALQLFLDAGVSAVADHDQRLVERLLDKLDTRQYELISPRTGPTRSTLIVLGRRDGSTSARHRRLTEAGVDAAYREGNLRLSVHLFNTPAEIDRALGLLHA
jgi:cysteine desulfurase / selenocysteine lyase